jgi:alpha-galactosidase
VVKKLGFTWVTLDDGWQTAKGDWFPNPKKFPGGDRDVKALVDEIRSQGFKAQLWWAPLAADPGTKLLAEHRRGAAEPGWIQTEDQLVGLLVSLSANPRVVEAAPSACGEDHARLGFRWPETGRAA